MPRYFYPGDRVTVYDRSMNRYRLATVVRWYGKRVGPDAEWICGSLVDVRFDGRDTVSEGHFTDFVNHFGE